MSGTTCRTVGLTLRVDSLIPRWSLLATEACGGQESDAEDVDVHVSVEQGREPFSLRGFDPLTRGAWSDGKNVVLEDACASGLDLHVAPQPDGLHVRARPRPSWSHRGLGVLAPARAQLLWRAVLMQYPALWWAGCRGAAPLHVSALQVDGAGVVLAGPGGVGKSTLLRAAVRRGAEPVSDNVCAGRAGSVHGLLEPMRVEGGGGRRMPHGRRESGWALRRESVRAERLLLLRRGSAQQARLAPMDPGEAARLVSAGTYAAGELRRYWAFCATLALGTGLGPAHPPVDAEARELAEGTECWELRLPAAPGTELSDVLRLADAGPSNHRPTGVGAP